MAIYGERGKRYEANREKYLIWVLLVMQGHTLRSIGKHYGVTGNFVRIAVVRELYRYLGESYPIYKMPPMNLPKMRKKHKNRIIAATRKLLGKLNPRWLPPADNTSLDWKRTIEAII